MRLVDERPCLSCLSEQLRAFLLSRLDQLGVLVFAGGDQPGSLLLGRGDQIVGACPRSTLDLVLKLFRLFSRSFNSAVALRRASSRIDWACCCASSSVSAISRWLWRFWCSSSERCWIR